jgi:hypothetical protein
VVSTNSGAQQRKHHQIEGGVEVAAFERGFQILPSADRVFQIPQQEARDGVQGCPACRWPASFPCWGGRGEREVPSPPARAEDALAKPGRT